MKVQFVDVDGTRTRCFWAGDESAPPLLMIHGFSGTAEIFIRNLEALGERRHVIAPDMACHGFTGPLEFGQVAPHRALTEHIAGLVRKLGLTKFDLFGNSYGGYIATLLYFQNPAAVSRLIIANSAACFDPDDCFQKSVEGAFANIRPALRNPTYESCRLRLTNNCYDARSVPPEVVLPLLTAYAQPWYAAKAEEIAGAMAQTRVARADRVLDRLQEIVAPTLVVWGRDDPRTDYDNAVKSVSKMPRGRIETVMQCNHYPFLEHPEWFNRTVLEFLAEGV
jgi:pimeloyl-ACP methyl ester carboxylesterase